MAEWTFAIQRNEYETDHEDYVTYNVFFVAYLNSARTEYTLSAVSTDYMETEAHAVVVANRIAAEFRAHGSTAEVIHLPTRRVRHPELHPSFLG